MALQRLLGHRNFGKFFNSATLSRGPLRDGTLGKRPLETEEISIFACSILEAVGDQGVSSHFFKATTLAWPLVLACGRRSKSATVLGHHELQSKPLAVYSRDMLTRSLKLYESMLLTIRSDTIAPDTICSGWMRESLEPSAVIKVEDAESEAAALPGGLVRPAARDEAREEAELQECVMEELS